MIAFVFVFAVFLPVEAHAQTPPRWVTAPAEKALSRVSFGPTVGVAPIVSADGAQALVTLGFGVGVFELWGVTDPGCEERRRQEREALGGDRIGVWGKVIERAQQPCRFVEQGWRPAYDGGLELGFTPALSSEQTRAAQLRGYFAPISFWHFTLGGSVSAVTGEREGAERAVGVRLGPELAWHHRFGGEQSRARHVVSLLLRPEASLVATDVLPHQVVLGGRFLFDL